MPHLVEMRDKAGKENLVIITVSVDELTDKEKASSVRAAVAGFLQKAKAHDLINFHLDNVESDELDRRFRNVAPPIYYVFDRRGKWIMPDAVDVEKTVQKFLDEK